MKKLLLLLCSGLIVNMGNSQTQSLPYIGTMTVIPQSPTPADHIKIVTHVTTPNQGVVVDRSLSVSYNPNQINIRGCYSDWMLPAIKEYIDTFMVGQLPAGTYTVKQKAYLSTAQQHCAATDSNMAMITLIVGNIVGLNESDVFSTSIFPNPVKDFLHCKNSAYSKATIYSYDGRLIRNSEVRLESEIDVRDLPAGLYFIRFYNDEKSQRIKFIKSN